MATPAVLKKLGALTSIVYADAEKKYKLSKVTQGEWHVEDIVGDEPETVLVRNGNAKIAGDIDLTKNVSHTVCVIAGDLTVTGTLSLTYGLSSVLYVTGNVRAKQLVLHSEVHLWIGGNLEIDGFILDELDDGGHLRVRGGTTAKAIVFWGRGDSRAHAKTPKAKLVAVCDLPEPYTDADQRTVSTAIAKGKDVLAAPKELKGKAPAKTGEWKTQGPTVTKKKPALVLATLAKWKPIAIDDASKRFDIGRVCGARDWKGYVDFRDTPKPVYAYQGDVHVPSLRIEGVVPFSGVYVIAGDLVVDGPLIIANSPGVLVVTGNVRARDVVVTEQGLWVGGDLEASDVVITANELHVSGTLRAKALIVEWVMPELTRPPEARIVINGGNKPVRNAPPNPPFYADLVTEPFESAIAPALAGKNMFRLAEALRAGQSLLR